MKRKLFVIVVILFAFFSNFNLSSQNTIIVVVKEVRNPNGVVNAALYTQGNWLSKIECVDHMLVDSKTGAVTLEFNNVPVGKEYAIAVIHDEDENEDCTLSKLGLPKEGVGFSNDAPIKFGPPKWQDAKFYYNGGKVVKIIKCRYWF